MLDLMRRSWRPVLIRSALFFSIWLVMVGGEAATLVPALVAAAMATWASFALWPVQSDSPRVQALAMLGLVLRFGWGSLVAGLDIAKRAFSPGPPLDPGFVVYTPRLPDGAARNLFMSVTSLMPGTLCTATEDSGALVFHCLDVGQPVLRQLAEEEARLGAALGVRLDVHES